MTTIVTIKALYAEAEPAKVAHGFYFSSFNTYEKRHEFINDIKSVIYPLPLTEEKALTIERNRDSLKVFTIFQVDKVIKHQFKAYVGSGDPFDSGYYNLTRKFIKAKNVSIVLANPEEKKIYLKKDILEKK